MTLRPDPDRPVRQRRRSGYLALAACLIFQVWALYLATPSGDPGLPYADKAVHVLMFAAPAALAVALRARAVLGVLLVHAVVSEPMQSWLTAGRVSDVWDAIADLVGIAVGIVVGVAVIRDGRRVGQAPSGTLP